ncbi:hypothetical protein [Flavobacterium sp. GCM10023249]|uniref:hypothetical protein n=1 Tax=unclassified Flavobacterium TaxID=196869 RepID=UPI003607046F
MQHSYFFLVLLFLFQSCEKKETDLQFEQNVLDQVFVDIVHQTYKDKRVYTFNCKEGKPIFEKGNPIGWDHPECEKHFIAIQKDTLGLVVAISDSVQPIDSDDKEFIPSSFKIIDTKKYRIPLADYNSQKFQFKYLSELRPDDEFENWSRKYPKFIGNLKISKIYFDPKRENGVVTVYYFCGSNCGLGYVVYLQKDQEQWKVKKTENTWIY